MNKKRAIIGLGQSGTMMVDDLVPFLSDTEIYCVNSADINTKVIENISFNNRFCFNQDSGFAKLPDSALKFLKENNQIQKDLHEWVHQIYTSFDETLLITFFTSGTGIGTLIDILKYVRNECKDYSSDKSLSVIVCASIDSKYHLDQMFSQSMEIKKHLSDNEFALFLEYKNSNLNEAMGRQLGFNIPMYSMRYIVLDILLKQKYKDAAYLSIFEKEFFKLINQQLTS